MNLFSNNLEIILEIVSAVAAIVCFVIDASGSEYWDLKTGEEVEID